LAVRDLNRRLKLSLPESESYTTIAGFLMTEAGHVLKPEDVITYNSLEFKVDRVEKRRVIGVRLKLPKAPDVPAHEVEAKHKVIKS
jgi:CBS domain containing-hemolysin-like protein